MQLINDFVALGYGLLTVDRTNAKEVRVLQDAPVQAGAPIATIGAGTGLGECFLTPGEGGHYVAYPSEGGHAEFPPRTETEVSHDEVERRDADGGGVWCVLEIPSLSRSVRVKPNVKCLETHSLLLLVLFFHPPLS